MRARSLLVFLWLTLGASVVHAQEAPLVLVVNAPRYEQAAQRALRPRVFSTEAFRCDPSEVSCALAYVGERATAQLLFVNVLYERRACVPIVRGGRVVGSRMPRVLVVTVRLYGHEGHLLRESHTDMPGGGDERAFTAEQVRAFFANTP